MSTRQKIAIVIFNVVLVFELCLTMYICSKDPENLTSVFLKYFFLMIIPTFIIGRFIIRRLRSREAQETGVTAPPKPDIKPPVYSYERYYHEPDKGPIQSVDFAQASKRRKLAGRIAAFFIIIMFVALLDSCIARFSQPINVMNVLPGTSVEINGPLEEKIKNVQDLTYVCSSDLIQVSLDKVYSGFWFGGTEWSGTLTISPHIEIGEYRLTVMPKVQTSKKPPVTFLIRVYQDEISYRKSSSSFIRRYTGIYPWWVIAVLFPLTVLSFLTVFYLSRKVERLMAKEGEAEVFWMGTGLTGYEIAFGLGTKHGVKPGDRLTLYNEEGRPVGTVEVQKASETDSTGIVGFDSTVRPGYIVSAHKH